MKINKWTIKNVYAMFAILAFVPFNVSFAAKTDLVTDNLVKAKLTGGTFVCGGGSFSDTNFTNYGINNFNDSQTMNIDSIQIYNAGTGDLVFDTDRGDPVPANFRMVIGPHQRSIYRSRSFFPTTNLHTQTFFSWSSADGTPIIEPGFGGSRVTDYGVKNIRCRSISEY